MCLPTLALQLLPSDSAELAGPLAAAAALGALAGALCCRLTSRRRGSQSLAAPDDTDLPVATVPNEPQPRVELTLDDLERRRLERFHSLARDVGHDFRNLLTSILGFCELARASNGVNAETRADLEQILRAAQQGAGLTDRLHAFARSGEPGAPVIDETLEKVVDALEAAASERPGTGNLHLEASAGNATARSMPGHFLEAVLLELLELERTAVGSAGRLVIRSSVAADSVTVELEARGEPGYPKPPGRDGSRDDAPLRRALVRLVETHGGTIERTADGASTRLILPAALPDDLVVPAAAPRGRRIAANAAATASSSARATAHS